MDFFGWELPVQFTSIPQEHLAVRQNAGLFDISHMGQVFVEGPQAEEKLQVLITNDVRAAVLGKGVYAHLLTPEGTVIDDLYVFRVEEHRFLLIVNASRKYTDLQWIKTQLKEAEVSVREVEGGAGLALQGPKSPEILKTLFPKAAELPKNGIGQYQTPHGPLFISRTGYTGEDGFELFGSAPAVVPLWDRLIQAGTALGLAPCGLGARDTLRTEVGYPLYGHELDERHTPYQAGLGWVVKLDKGEFIGREALLKQKSSGMAEELYGFKVESGGVARPGSPIFINKEPAGTVASGTFSPSLKIPIGMAYLPAATGKEGARLDIVMGSRQLAAVTVRMPFLKR